jgi:hypothetical protein
MVAEFNCFNFNDEWYLVEMLLEVSPQDIEFDEFVVPEDDVPETDWQTVLAEQFLNQEGTKKICELYDTPDTNDSNSRIAFFIYKTDSHTLKTPYGDFELTDSEQVPERLKTIIEIDEDYM